MPVEFMEYHAVMGNSGVDSTGCDVLSAAGAGASAGVVVD